MISFNSLSDLDKSVGSTVVTIGKFDGIHLGHMALMSKAKEVAHKLEAKSLVLTFDKHPGSVISPSSEPAPLIGPTQKQELIRNAGIEILLTIPFNESLASLNPEVFVVEILKGALSATAVVVGEDFKFGANQAGDAKTLVELGGKYDFEVHVVPSVEVDNSRVSTTRVRALLERGDVAGAARLIGRLHATTGEVEHGLKIGRELGFPTANISRAAEGFLPMDGVYAGWLHAKEERYPAALSIGINETITAVPRLLEVHVLDRRDLDLYDQRVNVEYVEFIRPTLKFDSVEALIVSINEDLDKIRAILG